MALASFARAGGGTPSKMSGVAAGEAAAAAAVRLGRSLCAAAAAAEEEEVVVVVVAGCFFPAALREFNGPWWDRASLMRALKGAHWAAIMERMGAMVAR